VSVILSSEPEELTEVSFSLLYRHRFGCSFEIRIEVI